MWHSRNLDAMILFLLCSVSCGSSTGHGQTDGEAALWLLATESRGMGTAERRIEVYADGRYVCSASEANLGGVKSGGQLARGTFARLRRDVEQFFLAFPESRGSIPADANVLVLSIEQPKLRHIAVRPEDAETRAEVRQFVAMWNRVAGIAACRALRQR